MTETLYTPDEKKFASPGSTQMFSSVVTAIAMIESFMKAAGGGAREWRVGLAKDGRKRLESIKLTGMANTWEVASEKMAIAVVAYFLQSGCQLDGNETGATQIYAYRGTRAESFQDFITKKAQADSSSERVNMRTEWIDALTRLTKQMREWLAGYDSQVLKIQDVVYPSSEEGLGKFNAPGLRIIVGDAMVSVRPVGRNVVGGIGLRGDLSVRAQGRVDITNEVQKYVLYRINEGEEAWIAFDASYRQSIFDKKLFETILEELLS